MSNNPTLQQFLHQACKAGDIPHELEYLLNEAANACLSINHHVTRGSLLNVLGSVGELNVQGEEQKQLDVLANDMLIEHILQTGVVAGLASEEMENCVPAPHKHEDAPYLFVFDPLDGSSNVDINMSVGTIFSILPTPQKTGPVTNDNFLQKGREQVAAGFCLLGPATMFVLTFGSGVQCFTLDPDNNEFVLVDLNMHIPHATQEYAINSSNRRHWHAPIKQYIGELEQGIEGVRSKNYNTRWIASMVAEIYRILCRGGIFIYPSDARKSCENGKLRLLYEGNPMAMIIEQADGAASTSEMRILEIQPSSLHQKIPVFMGAQEEVSMCEKLHAVLNDTSA